MLLSHIAFHVGDKGVAEELASDVFFSVYKNIETYDPSKSFILTWLFVITNNRLRNYYRDRKAMLYYDELENNFFENLSTLDEEMVCNENRMLLEKYLKKLEVRERKIIISKYYLGMNSNEIGRMLGLTAGNVRIILKRALEKIKQNMEKDHFLMA